MRRIVQLRLADSVEFGGASGAWRELLSRADLASDTGVAHAWRRVVRDLRHARGNRLNRQVAQDIWTAAAERAGATLTVLDKGFFEIRRGGAVTRVYEQTPPANDDVAVQLADHKGLVYRLLQDSGIRVPDHLEFDHRQVRDALRFLEESGGPCVVKPAVGGCRGFGVTSQLREPADVRRAARWAARFSPRLLIERQVDGDVYRVLVFDGRVVDAVRRGRPSVTGDGHSTIAELVDAEYERRIRVRGMEGARPLVIDLDSVLTLRGAGRSPGSVPGEGEVVAIKTVTNQNRLEDNETVRRPIPDALYAAPVAATAAVRLRLSGVDIVTPDPDVDGVVLDVNARPGLWHHYRVREANGAIDVAAEILESLL